MKEVTEKYYISTDGRKFNNENECKEYEEAALKIKTIKNYIMEVN